MLSEEKEARAHLGPDTDGCGEHLQQWPDYIATGHFGPKVGSWAPPGPLDFRHRHVSKANGWHVGDRVFWQHAPTLVGRIKELYWNDGWSSPILCARVEPETTGTCGCKAHSWVKGELWVCEASVLIPMAEEKVVKFKKGDRIRDRVSGRIGYLVNVLTNGDDFRPIWMMRTVGGCAGFSISESDLEHAKTGS